MIHPRTLQQFRTETSWGACAGVLAPSYTCICCGKRKLVRGGYKVPSHKRGKVCLDCHKKGEIND